MANSNISIFDELSLDHVEFYVHDTTAAAAQFTDSYGFEVYGASEPAESGDTIRSVALGRNRIRLVLTTAQGADHPVAAYVAQHGDGVADIALTTSDAAAAFTEAVRRGAVAVAEPAERGGFVTASIRGFGDVIHTFVQRPAGEDARSLPGFSPGPGTGTRLDSGLNEIDHFAVCLEAGQLSPTVEFYEKTLDFRMIFEERILVGGQAMDSKVIQSRTGSVTLTLIEPDTSLEPGQIDGFLKNHGGAGVQHIAFTADDIVESVGLLKSSGVAFLSTPDAYYRLLAVNTAKHSVPRLRELDILVDEDHDGQLFQIFTSSVHPRGTFFMEVIERLGARTFGSGNIKALYEAVERQRAEAGAEK
ncbi:4-hydroxyphenylpyruvate dioxygenase [Streptomyces parvulus]|uniref:4-hydroxyphenylpyruvate dioxygenase n=1 Tax=Streptomyces parvulus TaxID=146923 RepID=UPI001E2F2AE2|nr:4-hydroxyphenylpyruvate dioxygenase [Streptomyces parvulus]MCC9158932.1 4-hydroxyphenylpyruvate dioxygenase [Streptomyces parvulus]MCE7691985.1 4-hydroxyphenylpyruvate dioxygenase [Streptomyces parvulus]